MLRVSGTFVDRIEGWLCVVEPCSWLLSMKGCDVSDSYFWITLFKNLACKAHPVSCVAHCCSKVSALCPIAWIEGASKSDLMCFGSEMRSCKVMLVTQAINLERTD